MYPSISDLINDFLGTSISLPIQTFGFFVALAFILASYVFTAELKRREKLGLVMPKMITVWKGKPLSPIEIGSAIIIGGLIGYKLLEAVFHYSDLVDDPQGFLLSFRGNIFGAIALAGFSVWLRWRDKAKERVTYPAPQQKEEAFHPHQHVGNMTIIAAIFGLLGAKIFHLLENPDEAASLFQSVDAFFSGLTMYGGLFVGGGAVLVYAWRQNLNLLHVMDACAPGLMLAYGVGRVGCQMSGDGDWGIDNLAAKPGWLSWAPDWAWSYTYPHNVINAGGQIPGCSGSHCSELLNPVWPTPLYESLMCIGLFFVLWALRKRIVATGTMFSIYLVMNGVERFFIEKIRINEITLELGSMEITQAEIISTVLFLAGIAGILYFRKRHQKAMAQPASSPTATPENEGDHPTT